MNENKCVNAIRILSADQIQKANSGHPGLPLGSAPMAYELWAHHLKHNPANSHWFNRDRFILSAGHGSAMLYSLLHLFGYGLTIEDLKQFRQVGSKTMGHPEYGHTIGVEATTGPLGAGLGMAVGMALAEKILAEKFNKKDLPLVDHYTYALCGDGCLMEGISHEILSFAGNLALDKLIILYDSNNITIEGDTSLAFGDDTRKRLEAYNFQVIEVEDGNNLEMIGDAIKEAKKEKSKPSMIIIKTKIGYGVPAKEGKASAHGEPLGVENIKELRKNLNWEYDEDFYVPDDVYSYYKEMADQGKKEEEKWNDLVKLYKEKYSEDFKLFEKYLDGYSIDENNFDDICKTKDIKKDATRNYSGQILNDFKEIVPNLVGGSADLGPSNKTELKEAGWVSKDCFDARNIHFGVREIGMTAIANGILLHGGLKSYVATFLVFADYMKPMIRLSAIMEIPQICVFTHDSIGVGEDGPTHQPISQLTMLRSIPNVNVWRPADYKETYLAWESAINSKKTPSCMALTRQAVAVLPETNKDARRGGYIVRKEKSEKIDLILMASGSELSLALDASDSLTEQGYSVRVVSMPCMEVFLKQDEEYRNEVLPKSVSKRVAVEAAAKMPWYRFVGEEGSIIGIDEFGQSGPADQLFELYGYTAQNIVNVCKGIL